MIGAPYSVTKELIDHFKVTFSRTILSICHSVLSQALKNSLRAANQVVYSDGTLCVSASSAKAGVLELGMKVDCFIVNLLIIWEPIYWVLRFFTEA